MISEKESIAISYIRVGSMLAIVLCHILQVYSNLFAFVFNIGVQVFLALSGYLYGKKLISNWGKWTIGRIKRVYVPMFIFLIILLPFYLIFHREFFLWKAYVINLINLQGVSFAVGGDMIQGIRHLWFITAIMFAYFSTPFLQRMSTCVNWMFPFLLVSIVLLYLVVPAPYVFMASWVYLYAICYLYVHLKKAKIYNIGLLMLELLLIVLVASKNDVVTSYYHPLNRFFHDVSGVFIVIFGIRFLTLLKINSIPRLVGLMDKYSFHVFIVHYFFIIGPFSLAHITSSIFVNILFIVVSTLVATYIFVIINNLINRLLVDKYLLNV